MAPPNDTFRMTINAKARALCRFRSGVSPRTEPSAIPAATWPGVPSEWRVSTKDCRSFRKIMAEKLVGRQHGGDQGTVKLTDTKPQAVDSDEKQGRHDWRPAT